DIWLRAYLPPHEVMERLQAVCVCGLPVIGAAYVPASDKALTVTHLCATYEVVLGTVPSVSPSVLQQAFDRVVSQGALVVEKKGKLKEYDLKTHLGAPICVREIEGSPSLVAVSMTLITQQDGSLRPEQLVAAARVAVEEDATELGLELVRVTRVRLEVEEATAHTKAPAPSRTPLRRPGRPRQGRAR
ncbi:MAG: DUF2344 domain-containing protein, partial [Coriobacteriales bacterium]|nr:DUF2344 domain-containing protein [Coriobacteriales bacterium]